MKKFFLCSLLFVLICSNVVAQINDPDLETINEVIREQCIHKVTAFTKHLEKIAKKEESDSIKDYHISACLDLFIGRGNDTKDDDGNLIFPAPRIEVSSLTTGRTNSYRIETYLNNLKSLKYSTVEFETSKCYLAEGGIQEVRENLYSAVVSFWQVFVGYSGEIMAYRDNTQKTVTILITKLGPGRYDVLLGDTKVKHTNY